MQHTAFQWKRWLRAAIVASAWALGALVLLISIVTLMADGGTLARVGRDLVIYGPIYLLIAVPSSLALSLIGHFLLRALGLRARAAFVVGGALLGATGGLIATQGKNAGLLIVACAFSGAAAGAGYHRSYFRSPLRGSNEE